MVFVTRHVGETLVLGEGEGAVRVRLSEYRAGKLRFAISAPGYMAVHREEVWQRILAEAYGLDVKVGRPPGGGSGNLMLARYPGEALVFVDTRDGYEGWRKPFAVVRYEPPPAGRRPGPRARLGVDAAREVRVWGGTYEPGQAAVRALDAVGRFSSEAPAPGVRE